MKRQSKTMQRVRKNNTSNDVIKPREPNPVQMETIFQIILADGSIQSTGLFLT